MIIFLTIPRRLCGGEYSLLKNLAADIVFKRIQSLSEKEFALGGPMDSGPIMSVDTMSADLRAIHKLNRLKLPLHRFPEVFLFSTDPIRIFRHLKSKFLFLRKCPDQ